MFIDQPDIYFVLSGKGVWTSVTRDPATSVPTITAASRNFERQSDRDSDTKLKNSKTRLLMYPMTTNYTHTINIHTQEQFTKVLGYIKQYMLHSWWEGPEN